MNPNNLPLYYKLGAADKDWYLKHQLFFEKRFGPERLVLVTNLFAATSINSSLKSNIRLFRKALYEIENDKPFSNYLPVMKMQLERIRKGEQIRGQKINSFARAMQGDVDAVVVDVWLLRAFEQDRKYFRKLSERLQSGGASSNQYTVIEQYVRHQAYSMGLEPRQLSAIIWSGVRTFFTGKQETGYINILEQQLFNLFETV